MIENFVCGEEVLRLRNPITATPGTHETNIFDIDSISLLIGENGAGKTYVLDSIFDGLDRIEPDPRPYEWDPVLSQGPGLDGKVGVVYLSNAPHHRKKEPLNPWCIDASPRLGATDIPDIFFELDKVLGMLTGEKARINATWRINPRLILRHCIGMMLHANMKLPKVWEPLDREFAELGFEYGGVKQSFGDRTVGGVPQRMPIVGTYLEFDAQVAKLLEEMFILLCEGHSADWAALFYLRLDMSLRRDTDARTLYAIFEDWSKEADLIKLVDEIDDEDGDEMRALRDMIAIRAIPIRVETRDIKVTIFLTTPLEVNQIKASPLKKRVKIFWDKVSSGLWALATQCEQLRTAIGKLAKRKDLVSILVLIDEGDAFLHLEWQRQYIDTMNRFLSRCKQEQQVPCLQLVIATHSPLLATDVPRKYVNRIHERKMIEAAPSFAAPLQTLLNTSFGTKTIGEHAMRTISAVMRRIADRAMVPEDHYVIDNVDDPVIRRELERLIRLNGERTQ